MAVIGCPVCLSPLRPSDADFCALCDRLVCTGCLRDIGDAHPSGLKPGVYCLTCLGDTSDPQEPGDPR